MIRKKAIPLPKELEEEHTRLIKEWDESVSDIPPEDEVPPERGIDLYISTHCSNALLSRIGSKRPKGWKRPKK